ncbi:MAG: hypothetical protein HPY66_2004 [Firmicutes bacterium]|nr:hypothetical protein [Bacillota bacterium]
MVLCDYQWFCEVFNVQAYQFYTGVIAVESLLYFFLIMDF